MFTNSDWMSLFLAGLTGASVGWGLCSLWTLRWIEQERQRMRDETMELVEIAQSRTRELERLQLQEHFNRERA
jgi:hypothetical protein